MEYIIWSVSMVSFIRNRGQIGPELKILVRNKHLIEKTFSLQDNDKAGYAIALITNNVTIILTPIS